MIKGSKALATVLIVLSIVFASCKGGESPTAPPIDLAPFTVTVKASPTTVASGGSSEISWTASRAASKCTSALWDGTKPATGIVSTGPLTGSRTYMVSCTCDNLSTSGEVTVTVQTPQTCTYTVIPGEATLNSCKAGEEKSFAVVTQAGCPINPQSLAPWLEVVPCTSSCNNIRVRAREDNNTGVARVGVVKVADGCELRVTQPACTTGQCSFDVYPVMASFSCPGGDVTFTVTTGSNCGWAPESTIPGFTFVDAKWTVGSGRVTLRATGNGTSPRVGEVTIAGRRIPVNQDACTVTPQTCQDPNATNYGGPLPCTYPTTYTATASCTRTTTAWKTCPNGSTVSGSGSATRSATRTSSTSQADAQAQADAAACADAQAAAQAEADANAQAAVANCASTCTITVPPNTPTVSCQGTSNGSIVFSGTPGCTWTASSSSSFVTLTSATSGTFPASGSVSVQFSVSNNSTGGTRTGTVTISGRNVSIPQEACTVNPTCSFTVPPSTPTVSSAGTSNGSIIFSGTAGCTWTASTTDHFLFLDGPTSGTFPASGSASVKFTVAGNGGAARTGRITITVAGESKTTMVPQSAYPN